MIPEPDDGHQYAFGAVLGVCTGTVTCLALWPQIGSTILFWLVELGVLGACMLAWAIWRTVGTDRHRS